MNRSFLAASAVALAGAVLAAGADKPAGTAAASGAGPSRGLPRPSAPRGDGSVAGLFGEERAGNGVRKPAFRRPPAAAIPDQLQVVFFTNARPVRVAVTVRVNGRSFADAWDGHLRHLFAGFDRDRDGHLNRYEVEHIFSARGLSGLLAGAFFYRTPAGAQAFDELDRDGDERVSFDEFAAYYRDAGVDMLRPRFVPAQDPNDQRLTRDLFARLDLNKDDKLSRDEVKQAEKLLAGLDADDDEALTASELFLPRAAEVADADAAPAMMAMPAGRTAAAGAADLQLFRGPVPGSVTQQLLKRYDANKDFHLTAAESGFDTATFARLDADTDGRLSAAELEVWRTGPADAVAVLDLGDKPAACKAEVKPGVGSAWPAGMEVRAGEPGRAALRVGTQFLDLSAAALPPEAADAQNRRQLEAAYPEGRDSITEDDIGGPQYQFLRIVYDSADFNGDGRLTRAEFRRYLALQQSTIDMALAASHAVRTPNLFQLMDENGDGRLGVRELRTAFDRLIVLEPGGGELVTKAALQPSAAVRLGRMSRVAADGFVLQGRFGQTGKSAPAGPLWFTRMDRNGDGDLSRAEFLGTREQFDVMDENKDGLVSAAEATAFDKKVRK